MATKLAALVLEVAVLALGAAGAADAACNLIPVAQRRYASTMGGIVSPITAPGQAVELLLTTCDGSLGFEPNASDNTVTLKFQPPGVGADTDVPITLADNLEVDDCTLPGGRCAILRFTTPSTIAALPPHGLAGPAQILVTDLSATLVAQIDSLSIPTIGCDDEPDGVFQQLTVLPPSNLMADLVAGIPTEVRATIDGGGNMLIPFDHWGGGGGSSVLADVPGSTVAILLSGTADIPALSPVDPNTILEVLAAQANPERWVRSFTLDGRPLPPLLRLTASGELFGAADAVASALRFQRNDGEGGPNLYNLEDRFYLDRGPVLISTYTVDRRDPLPLVSLRASAGAVGYGRSEPFENDDLNFDGDEFDSVVQVLDVATGSSTPTYKAVAFVGEAAMRPPAIGAAGNIVAFLESEASQNFDYTGDSDLGDSILRVYRSDGVELSTGLDIPADTAPLLNRRTLAISGDRVFFRTPGSVVQTLHDNVGGVDGLDAAPHAVISPDGLYLYTSSQLDNGVGVFLRNIGTGALTFVDLEPVPVGGSVNNLVLSPDGNHLYVRSWSPGNAVTVFARNPINGLLTFVEQEVDGVGGVDGLDGAGFVEVSPDGESVYVASGGNAKDNAIAVFARDTVTGELTFVEAEPGLFFVESLAVSPNGAHLYATTSGDVSVFARDAGTGALALTQAVPTYNPRTFAISPDGLHVYVGGGFPEDIVLFARDPVTGMLSYVSGLALPVDPDGTGGISASAVTSLTLSLTGGRLYVDATRPLALERDPKTGSLETVEVMPFQNAHAVVSPDNRYVYWIDRINNKLSVYRPDVGLAVFDNETGGLRSFGIPATRAAIANEKALFLRPEDVDGTLWNGDGDAADFAAHLLDTSGLADVLTPLGVSARNVGMSNDLIALIVSEGSEGEVDRNNDNDALDTVLAVAEVTDPTDVRYVEVAADAFAVSGNTVVFARPEWMEKRTAPGCEPTDPVGGCDLNGNGQATDRVLQVYRHEPGGVGDVENVGWQVSAGEATFGLNELFPDKPEAVASSSVVAFLTDEAAAGVDLNGDFDTTDIGTMQFLNLAAPGAAPINTGLPGVSCDFPSCEPALPFRVDEERGTVSFITWEAMAGVDLDGNGSFLDFVLNVYNLSDGKAARIPLYAFGGSQSMARLPEEFLDGQIVYSFMNEFAAGEDLNGDGIINGAVSVVLSGDADDDGVFDNFDTCVEEGNAQDVDADEDGLGDFTCDPNPIACPSVPFVGCTQLAVPQKGSLQLKDDASDDKDSVRWLWNAGDATAFAELGDPVSGTAHYSLCVYDASVASQPVFGALVRPRLICDLVDGKTCWSKAGKTGFKMKDNTGAEAGITQMRVASGAAGKSKMQVRGKGTGLGMPTLPLSLPLVTQLVVRDGDRIGCWEAVYSSFQKNELDFFRAKSD